MLPGKQRTRTRKRSNADHRGISVDERQTNGDNAIKHSTRAAHRRAETLPSWLSLCPTVDKYFLFTFLPLIYEDGREIRAEFSLASRGEIASRVRLSRDFGKPFPRGKVNFDSSTIHMTITYVIATIIKSLAIVTRACLFIYLLFTDL